MLGWDVMLAFSGFSQGSVLLLWSCHGASFLAVVVLRLCWWCSAVLGADMEVAPAGNMFSLVAQLLFSMGDCGKLHGKFLIL